MAGGEFRLGTDSIYMADDGHIRPKGTSLKSWITWLRFERKTPGSESFQLLMRIARRKLGLTIDDTLTPAQRDNGLLLRRMLDDLYWVMSYSRWQDDRFFPLFRD